MVKFLMELRHLRYFIAVAEAENVTRAAERLHVSQPPLSRQIHDLEEELGMPLFHRTGKSLQLNAAGKVFLVEARAVLERAEQAMQAVQALSHQHEQTIDVGYAPSLSVEILPPILRLFEQSQFEEVSTIGRLDLYSSAWNLFLDNPLFGAGLEDPTFGGYPHNVVIEAFMATGFAGGVAFVIGVVAMVYAAFVVIRELPLYAWMALIALQQLLSAQFSGTLIQSTTMWGAMALMTSIIGLRKSLDNWQRVRQPAPPLWIQGQ